MTTLLPTTSCKSEHLKHFEFPLTVYWASCSPSHADLAHLTLSITTPCALLNLLGTWKHLTAVILYMPYSQLPFMKSLGAALWLATARFCKRISWNSLKRFQENSPGRHLGFLPQRTVSSWLLPSPYCLCHSHQHSSQPQDTQLPPCLCEHPWSDMAPPVSPTPSPFSTLYSHPQCHLRALSQLVPLA